MKKGLKITLIIVGALLFIVVLATLLVSPIAKSYVNNHGKDLIGRTINVEGLHVNVYTGHVAIHNLAVLEDNDKDTFAQFDTLDISIKLLKLLKEEVFLKHITLSGLDVNVLQDGSRFNFTSIIEFFPSDTTDEDTSASNWKINLHDIAIRNSHVYYADLQRKSHWDLKDLNIIVPDFCIGGTESTDAGLTVALADGGVLNADADFNSQTNEFDVSLGLKNFALNQVKPYLTDVVKLGDIEGRLGADITAKGVLDKIMDMNIKGTVNLDGIDVEDQSRNKLLSVNNITVRAKEIVLSKNLFNIESVNVSGLTSRYDAYADGRNNFTPILIPSTSTAKADTVQKDSKEETAAATPMDLRIGKLNLEDINFTYADHTLPDPFNFTVSKIHVESENLSLSGENTARVSAALPNGGKAFIRWSGNIDDWKKNQHLNLNISDLHLTDLSPYLVAYLGQPFTNGTFSFRSSNHITNSNLNGKNYIDIYKAEVGDRRKDVDAQMKLPLKAALYIIKDKDDKIQLDVPIAGNIDNPEFNYMKLVWKTLGNLIVKVATSPFKALGNALGFNGEDLEFMAIDPSQFGFTSEQFYQLDQIADILQKNPTMHVVMEQQLLPDTEDSFLQFSDKRNELLKKHMTDLGITDQQFSVRNASDTVTVKKNGYAIIATLEEGE